MKHISYTDKHGRTVTREAFSWGKYFKLSCYFIVPGAIYASKHFYMWIIELIRRQVKKNR